MISPWSPSYQNIHTCESDEKFGCISDTPPKIEADNKIDVSIDSKLKRQNNADGGGGEEVDLSVIQNVGQSGQQPNFPGQSPFFNNNNNNPFFQQPFLNNGFGFPQGSGLGQFPQGFGANFNPNVAGGFPQGVSPFGFQQGFGQTQPGRNNVILQNNGKQYLVQALTQEQRIIQKNGKQYLLQPISASSAALLNANGATGIPNYNLPNNLFSSFGQNNPLANGFNAGGNAFPGPFSPAVAAVQPSALASNAKLTSTVPSRVIVGGNGQKLEVEQIPIQNGGSPYLSSAVGAVAAQLASQAAGSGRQYAYRYQPIPLNDVYNRANEAGYGLYSTGRSDTNQKKRDT